MFKTDPTVARGSSLRHGHAWLTSEPGFFHGRWRPGRRAALLEEFLPGRDGTQPAPGNALLS